MAMVVNNLVSDLADIWTAPFPDNRSYRDTGDAIEAHWRTAVVSGGVSSATLFTSGITHGPLSPIGGWTSAAVAALSFEAACQAMVTATTFTPVLPAIITPPPQPLTATPGTLSGQLFPVFNSPASGTNAGLQALIVGGYIHSFLTGWQIFVQFPPSAAVLTPIL